MFSPSIIWVRAFHSVYDPATAIRVVGRLKKEFPDVRLTMLGRDKGDGSWQESHRIIKDLGLEQNVNMTGGVDPDDVPTYLQNNDIFLNTATVDNAPVSVIEALAVGLPVVSTNVGGIPDLVRNGESALLCNAGDADALAASIALILRDPALGQGLAREGRKVAESSDKTMIVTQWERLLHSLTD